MSVSAVPRAAMLAELVVAAAEEFAKEHPNVRRRHLQIRSRYPFFSWLFGLPGEGFVIILEVDRDVNPSNVLCRVRHRMGATGRSEVPPPRDPIHERYVFSEADLLGSQGNRREKIRQALNEALRLGQEATRQD